MEKFVDIQNYEYQKAYKEIKEGKKTSHWIWYIFPQIAGLGYSYISRNYEIRSLDEAMEYLKDDYLRNNLINISKALLEHKAKKNICDIMDDPLDAQKLLSCMTLFKEANKYLNYEDIFSKVINAFYNGKEDMKTIKILKEMNNNSKIFNYNNNKYPYTPNYFNKSRLPGEKYINISGDYENRQNNIEQMKKNEVEVKENVNFYSRDVNNQRATFSTYNGNEKDFRNDSNIYQNNIWQESLVYANNNNENLHQYPSDNYHYMKNNMKINNQIMTDNYLSCWSNNIPKKDNFNSQNKFDKNIRSNKSTTQNNNNFVRKNIQHKLK